MREGTRRKRWVCCTGHATGQVDTEQKGSLEIIVRTPPVWGKFIGQPLDNLLTWLRSHFGPVETQEL